MKVYRITGSQGKISFKQNIQANDYQDAKNKFINSNKKFDSYSTFKTPPDIIIDDIQTLKYS